MNSRERMLAAISGQEPDRFRIVDTPYPEAGDREGKVGKERSFEIDPDECLQNHTVADLAEGLQISSAYDPVPFSREAIEEIELSEEGIDAALADGKDGVTPHPRVFIIKELAEDMLRYRVLDRTEGKRRPGPHGRVIIIEVFDQGRTIPCCLQIHQLLQIRPIEQAIGGSVRRTTSA